MPGTGLGAGIIITEPDAGPGLSNPAHGGETGKSYKANKDKTGDTETAGAFTGRRTCVLLMRSAKCQKQ